MLSTSIIQIGEREREIEPASQTLAFTWNDKRLVPCGNAFRRSPKTPRQKEITPSNLPKGYYGEVVAMALTIKTKCAYIAKYTWPNSQLPKVVVALFLDSPSKYMPIVHRRSKKWHYFLNISVHVEKIYLPLKIVSPGVVNLLFRCFFRSAASFPRCRFFSLWLFAVWSAPLVPIIHNALFSSYPTTSAISS